MSIFGNINKRTPVDFNSVVNSNNLTYWSIRKAPFCDKNRVLLNVSFKQDGLGTEIEKRI